MTLIERNGASPSLLDDIRNRKRSERFSYKDNLEVVSDPPSTADMNSVGRVILVTRLKHVICQRLRPGIQIALLATSKPSLRIDNGQMIAVSGSPISGGLLLRSSMTQ